jgi:predicted HicB family RNase H-like nuclease
MREWGQMENTFEYEGYIGQFRYEAGDEAFHGTVVGLRDVIHFQGTCVSELRQAFQESVDDYLQWCRDEGTEPEKPYTGRFIVRLPPELHRKISVRAKVAGQSLNQWVTETLSKAA